MSPFQNNIKLFSWGFKKIFPVVPRVDSFHIPIIGDLVVDIELDVGGRDWALTGAADHQPVPGTEGESLLQPGPELLPDVEPGQAGPPAGRLHDAHHGVRRHRLELRGLRADLALVEAAGGEREVEQLHRLLVRPGEAHLSARDREGSGGRDLPGHPSVELHVVLVPLDTVQGLPAQLIVAPQLHALVNLGGDSQRC